MTDFIPGYTTGIELLPMLRPYLRQCGNSPRPAWVIDERKLLDYLLVYIEEGKGKFVIDGVKYNAEKNDLFWIPPDTIHYMEGYPPEMICPYIHFDLIYRPQVSHWDFSIPGGMTDLSGLETLMHPEITDPRIIGLKGKISGHFNSRIGDLINEICLHTMRATTYTFLKTSGLIMQIMAEILQGTNINEEGTKYVSLLEKAALYIHNNYENNIEIENLADICKLSESHFRKIFKAYFLCSPHEYITNMKIRKAKEYIIGSTMNFTEIAERLGFSTVHNLSRAFKRVTGLSPSEYKYCQKNSIKVDGRSVKYSH